MFTGIIQKIGIVSEIQKRNGVLKLTLEVSPWRNPLAVGESVDVDGVCLTVVRSKGKAFSAEVVPETLRATTLGNLLLGREVNLERSLKLGDSLGGHFVFGHVDGKGKIIRKTKRGKDYCLAIAVPKSLRVYLISKGSVAVDGISLTVQKVLPGGFETAVIPHTADHTTLGAKRIGDPVNLETDVMVKHIYEYLNRRRNRSKH